MYLRFSQFNSPDNHTANGVHFNYKIPITQQYNDIEYYTNSGDENIEDVELRSLSCLNLELIKYNGLALDLNNSDFSFLLELELGNN
jgi:hypothetical protein